jgi:hypothetical protein
MNNAWQLRKWLLIQPRAAFIRLTANEDAEPSEINCTRMKSWSKLSETIHAMQPELIEALDKDHSLIRAMRPSVELESSEAAPIPTIIANDPNAAMLTHFANLLHRAYEHSTQLAFTKMVDLVEQMGARSETIESRLERAEAASRRLERDRLELEYERLEDLREQAAAEKEDGGGLPTKLLEGFMSGTEVAKVNGAGRKGRAP